MPTNNNNDDDENRIDEIYWEILLYIIIDKELFIEIFKQDDFLA